MDRLGVVWSSDSLKFDVQKALKRMDHKHNSRGRKMAENLKEIDTLREFTSGLGFEDFYNIMVTVCKVTEAYKKINPNSNSQSLAEMWLNIMKLTSRPEEECEIIDAFRRLYPDARDLTFEDVKAQTKIADA